MLPYFKTGGFANMHKEKIPQSQAVLMACMGSVLIGTSGVFVRISDLGPISTGFYRIFFCTPCSCGMDGT